MFPLQTVVAAVWNVWKEYPNPKEDIKPQLSLPLQLLLGYLGVNLYVVTRLTKL